MIIKGYINRYQPGNTVSIDVPSIDTVPIDNNTVQMDAFIGGKKLIVYEHIPNGSSKSVYISNRNTDNTYVHLYTVLMCDNNNIALINTKGASTITNNYAVPVAECIFNRISTHAIENDGDVDYVQLVAMCNRNASTDTEDYLTTLDIKNYNKFLGQLSCYIDMTQDLQYLYDNYVQRVGFVSKGSFLDLPETIYNALDMLDIIGGDRDLTNQLICDTVNGIPCPKSYRKYDGKIKRLVDDSHITKCDHSAGRIIHGKYIEKDGYRPVYTFNDDLLSYCCSIIEDSEVEFYRKYILSKCSNLLVNRICYYLLVTSKIMDCIPLVMRIQCTLMEEVFITIETTKGAYKYFIDLTLIPLICHGLRYGINKELI